MNPIAMSWIFWDIRSPSHRKTGMVSSIITWMKDFNGEISPWQPETLMDDSIRIRASFQNDQICLLVLRIWEDWSGWWYFREAFPHIYIYMYIHNNIFIYIHIYIWYQISQKLVWQVPPIPMRSWWKYQRHWGEPWWFDELHSGASVGLWWRSLVGGWVAILTFSKGLRMMGFIQFLFLMFMGFIPFFSDVYTSRDVT